MNDSIFDQFRLTVLEKNLHVYGARVEKKSGDGATHFWRSDDLVNLYSVSKTFSSMAVGMCRDDGRLRLSDHVLDYFPEYRGVAAPGSEAITIRDLLHMASGKLEFWFGALDAERSSKDWAELFFRVPVTRKPGECFRYSNACTYMLGRIVEKVTGQTLRNFLVTRLFTPLGIENPQWHSDPSGHTLAATELYLTLGEVCRLGRLLLNHGEYGGKQLVSADYLKDLWVDTIDSSENRIEPEGCAGYGYQVWRCTVPGTYRADGMYGQYCIILPEQEAAVTITAHEEKVPHDIVRAVFSDIVPRLSE
jgi:CubicO group peptidase (beta-lactamase class C family)